jgi:LCP family protein required for cell wall assembly
MRLPKVNLLSGDRTVATADRTGRSPVNFFLSPVLVALIFVLSFGFGRLTLSETASFALSDLDGIPILGQMRHLISSADRKLAGEQDDRINILLLGMGGEGHEGPNLTDTIMVASIRPSDRKVALLSIPRDLIVPIPKVGWRKINSVNAFGELETRGRGGEQTREMIEGLLGLDIPYYVRVDFNGFKELIDGVDGVDIHVERSFTDYTYPTKNFGVQTVGFKEGWQTMDGETALRFARSRHGNNGEGSDFARAKRQQKVLNALKTKMLAAKTYRNPATIANTLAALQSNITTNLQIGEILRLARMAQAEGGFDIAQRIIDNGPDSPVVDGMFAGAYVLVPRNDDWSGLRRVATDVFVEAEPEASAPPKPEEKVAAEEKARVEIRNGTGKSGQARVAATSISGAGFEVVKIGNADAFTYTKTVIYDLTRGKKPVALARLRETVGDAEASATLPRSLKDAGTNVDFLVIIGKIADEAAL